MIAVKTKKHLNIKEFARLAGVSPATVSRVFSSNPLVKPETADQIKQLAKKYNFRPNQVASSAFNGKTKSIGVLLCNLRTSYFADIADGIQQVLLERDYLPIIISQRQEKDYLAIRRLIDHRVDGIIACLGEQSLTAEEQNELNSFDLPLATIDYYSRSMCSDNVQSDEEACGRLAAEYFLARGHRKFVVVAGTVAEELPRLDSFIRTLEQHGCALPPWCRVQYNHSRMSGEEAAVFLADWLKAHPDITACYGYNDGDALHLYQAARMIKRRVPDDLSIIGTADLGFAKDLTPGLTTIRQDGVECGKTAARMILERLASPELPFRQLITPVKLIERESVKTI